MVSASGPKLRAFLSIAIAAVGSVSIVASPVLAVHPDDSDEHTTIQERNGKDGVGIEGLRFRRDGTLDGTLVNRSDALVRNIRLLIRYDWVWEDERNPGPESPGRSFYHTVDSDIPAFGTISFHYEPTPSLPDRSDGRFVASVEVARFTQVRYRKSK